MEGERLKELRTNLGLSQEEMATRIGLSKSGISNIEKGKRTLIDRNIKLIVSEFNVSEKWLRTGEGEMFNPKDDFIETLVFDYGLDDLDKKILTIYAQLPAAQRSVLKEYLVRLANAVSSSPERAEEMTREEDAHAYVDECFAEEKGEISFPSAVSGEK